MRILFALALSMPGAEGAAQTSPADAVITVPAPERPAPQAKQPAIAYFEALCFDGLRLSGDIPSLDDSPDWGPLDASERARLNIPAGARAFSLVDLVRGHFMVLIAEEAYPTKGLREMRCTLILTGGTEHADLPAAMGALFKASGSPPSDAWGFPPTEGWRQLIWTGMPSRRSQTWEALRRPRNTQSTLLNVIEDGFYREHDYLFAQLLQREDPGAAPVSRLSLSWTTRAR